MSSSGVRQKSHSARSFLFLLPNDRALRPGLALPPAACIRGVDRDHVPWHGRLAHVYSKENTGGTPVPPVRQVCPLAQGESHVARGGEGAEDHQLANAPDIRHPQCRGSALAGIN